MTWEDFVKKITSRKLWVAICGLVSGLLLAFKVDAETVETVSGVIMALASVIAYIIGEGLVDNARVTTQTQTGTDSSGTISVNILENAALIAKILNADADGEAYTTTNE